jgi:Fe-S cluster biogenesis protein NfuA/nitrite reductase/ring-hydroxylating ferredoxin subunit
MDSDALLAHVQRLTDELEQIRDPDGRRVAEGLSAAVLELHGEGMRRLLEAVPPEDRLGLAEDPVVGSLLLLHDLYPVPLEERVQAALEQVRPYMESHGGGVELLGIEDGVARLRLEGSCNGCGASSSTLELAVERALRDAAPDLLGMDVEGAAGPEVTGVPLPMANGGGTPDWDSLDGVTDVAEGELRPVELHGRALVVARVEGDLLAYLDHCAACGSSLAGGQLADGLLNCPACERGFYLPRAGRTLDEERLQLDPVPLLVGDGAAKVALPV